MYFLRIFIFIFLLSCEDNFQEIQNINSKNISPIGITENLKLIYTDSAKVKAILYSNLNKDFTNQSFPYSEFPDGVKITFYDNDLNETIVTSDYAITYNKTNIVNLPRVQKENLLQELGITFQHGALFDSLKNWENIVFKVKNREKLSNKNAEILALSIIKNLGLEPKILNLYPSEISGGMQKRIAIARAICGNPKILLFDEPTSGLDPVTGSLIDKLIITAVKTVGGSAITITHDMSSVCRIADKVILIDNQTIGWSGTPKQMLKSKNSKIQEFIKSTNPNLFK